MLPLLSPIIRLLRTTDPKFWDELTAGTASTQVANNDEGGQVEDEDQLEGPEDDSNLPSRVVISQTQRLPSANTLLPNLTGGLSSAMEADSLDGPKGDESNPFDSTPPETNT